MQTTSKETISPYLYNGEEFVQVLKRKCPHIKYSYTVARNGIRWREGEVRVCAIADKGCGILG
jgi:hypothetical protein